MGGPARAQGGFDLVRHALGAATLGVLLLAGGANAAPTASGPYVTLLFSRTAVTAANNCTPRDTNVARLDTVVAPALFALGLHPTGSIETTPTIQSSFWCGHFKLTLFTSWSLAQQLTGQYGWSFVSHSATYPNAQADWDGLTPAGMYAQTCGSQQKITTEGLPGATGLFAWPDNLVYARAMPYVQACFDFNRLYTPTGTTDQPTATQPQYVEPTDGLSGGPCNDKAAPCYAYSFEHATGRYELPSKPAAAIAGASPSQWITLQVYLLVTGSEPGQWDCTSSNPLEHWTYDSERYCWSDYLSIVSSLAAGVRVVDPATVGAAWGRVATMPPGPVASIALSPADSTIAAGGTSTYAAEGFDAAGNDLGDLTAQTLFAVDGAGSCVANACGASAPSTYTVTASFGGVVGTARLVVRPGALASIRLSPATTTIGAGTTQRYAAEGFDAAGNDLGDVTAGTTFSVDGSGTCRANECGAATAGEYTVTGDDGGVRGTARQLVRPVVSAIVLAPVRATIPAGTSEAFTAEAFDAAGDDLGDATAETSFTIDGSGACAANVCGGRLAGTYDVTGTDGVAVAEAALVVEPGPVASIVLSPADTTIAAGKTSAYAAEGYDAGGNDLGDVTGETAFAIDGAGSCDRSACGASAAGAYTVTGTAGGATGSVRLTVRAGALASIVLSPAAATIATGTAEPYAVEGFDRFGNDAGDVTALTSFTIDGDGSCDGSRCGADAAGTYTVGAAVGAAAATARLVVRPLVASIRLTPVRSTIAAGTARTFQVDGFDDLGNDLGDVTAKTAFSISGSGTCSANACGADTPGSYVVTGTIEGIDATAEIDVTPGPLASLALSPAQTTIRAGGASAYAAEGFDAAGNDLGDVTTSTTFAISGSGTCQDNVCRATRAGAYTVTATSGSATSFAALTVQPGPLTATAVAPAQASIAAGSTQTYRAEAYDAYGNDIGDVTATTTFAIGQPGVCLVDACGATRAGAYAVTGTTAGVVATAALSVAPGPLASLVLSPAQATILIGAKQPYSAVGSDALGNDLGDLTATASFLISGAGTCQANACGASQAGTYTVRGTLSGVSGTAQLTVLAPPTVASFSPVKGAVGATVTVTGTSFSGVTAVTLGGVPAPFTVASKTKLTATVPATAATGPIAITAATGTGSSAASFAVTPVVSSFSPTSGPVGTLVTVTGTGLTGVTAVTFNGAVASFTVGSSTQVTATVPDAASTGKITVTTAGGAGASAASFSVKPTLTSFAPTGGPPGTVVTLTGSGFTGATAVAFNGTAATFTVGSSTQIDATVPAAATNGKVKVTTPGGSVTSATSFTVRPSLSGFSPASGPVGTLVTVTGAGFTGATTVAFNGTAAAFTLVSSTQITATVPASAATGKIGVTTRGGTATSSTPYLVTPTISGFTPASGPIGALVTIAGSGFVGATSVRFAGTAASYTVVSSTQMTATVPTGAKTGAIAVASPGGTAKTATSFTVTRAATRLRAAR